MGRASQEQESIPFVRFRSVGENDSHRRISLDGPSRKMRWSLGCLTLPRDSTAGCPERHASVNMTASAISIPQRSLWLTPPDPVPSVLLSPFFLSEILVLYLASPGASRLPSSFGFPSPWGSRVVQHFLQLALRYLSNCPYP